MLSAILGRQGPIRVERLSLIRAHTLIARSLSGKSDQVALNLESNKEPNQASISGNNGNEPLRKVKNDESPTNDTRSGALSKPGKDNGPANESKRRPTKKTSIKKAPIKKMPAKKTLTKRAGPLMRSSGSDTVIVNKRPSNMKRIIEKAVAFHTALLKKSKKPNLAWDTLKQDTYKRVEPPLDVPVPTLAHGLDRVLFNPGVHHLKDPRTGYFNFSPFLEFVTQPKDFNYDAIQPFIPSSHDQNLIQLARDHDKRFVGSTSSVSGALSHCYFALSNFKPVDTSSLSRAFAEQPKGFSSGSKVPVTIILRWKQGVHAVEADKSYDDAETVLSSMGKSMEKVLTLEQPEYERFLKSNMSQITEEDKKQPESYAYGQFGDLLLRSQLDCEDSRLARKSFDLKTRAVIPIRLDIFNYSNYVGYSLTRSHGLFESFEREYYDMMRAAFLKYSFQVRIGHMDGIMVAYHNTRKIFGFQYISREEMDSRLFSNTRTANQAFHHTLSLFHAILDKATEKYPEQDVRVSFEARESKDGGNAYLNVFVEAIPAEAELSPAEEFFQTDNKSLAPHEDFTLYSINLKSTVNDLETKRPICLRQEKDTWKVNYTLTESNVQPDVKGSMFRGMRKKQLDLVSGERSPPLILKRFRAISDLNMKTEKGKDEEIAD